MLNSILLLKIKTVLENHCIAWRNVHAPKATWDILVKTVLMVSLMQDHRFIPVVSNANAMDTRRVVIKELASA